MTVSDHLEFPPEFESTASDDEPDNLHLYQLLTQPINVLRTKTVGYKHNMLVGSGDQKKSSGDSGTPQQQMPGQTARSCKSCLNNEATPKLYEPRKAMEQQNRTVNFCS